MFVFSFCSSDTSPPPKAKRHNQAIESDSLDGSTDNTTAILSDPRATSMLVVANGTVGPNYWSLFTGACPITKATVSSQTSLPSSSNSAPCFLDPNDLQSGISCANPGSFNESQSTTIVGYASANSWTFSSSSQPSSFASSDTAFSSAISPNTASSSVPTSSQPTTLSTAATGSANYPNCPAGQVPDTIEEGEGDTVICAPLSELMPLSTLSTN